MESLWSSMKSITAFAAVVVTGFPPNVEMVAPFIESAISGRAIVTPMGDPLARPFALVMMSGCTPHCSIPNHLPPVRPHAGLHFVADEHAAVFLHDVGHDREIFLGRRDEAADALDRLGDKSGDTAGSGGANHFFHILRALHFAGRIRQPVRTAIAVCVHRVDDAGLRHRAEAPVGLAR